MCIAKIICATFLVVLCAAPGPLPAQATPVDQETFSNMINRWNAILDFPESLLADPYLNPDELSPLSENVELVNQLAIKAMKEAEIGLAREQNLLQALGAIPDDKEPPESKVVEEQRSALQGQVTLYDERVKQCKIIIARSKQILDRIGDLELSTIARILGKKSQSPLSPEIVAKGIRLLPDRLSEFAHSIRAWWRNTRLVIGWGTVGAVTFALLIVLGAFVLGRRWLVAHHGFVPDVQAPSLARRFVAILVEALSGVILPVALIVVAASFLISQTPLTNELERIFLVFAISAIQFVIVAGLAKTALTSENPQWRIVGFTDESAVGLERAIRLLATVWVLVNCAIVAVNPVQFELGAIKVLDLEATTEPTILVGMIGLILAVAASLNVMRGRYWRFVETEEDGDICELGVRPASLKLRILFSLTRVALVASVLLYLIGYLNLGLYIAGNMMFTLFVIALAVIVHGLVREGLKQLTSSENPVGRKIRDYFGLDDRGAAQWTFWIVLFLDIGLIMGMVVLVLSMWGLPWIELKPFFLDLMYGTEIGGHTFSLVSIAVALGAFVLMMLAVKLFQRALSSRILVQTRLDVGVRDAVTAGVGYAGVVVAVLVALSLIGLKFGEIALIFSALSIGIGFGLQHVVNNFISGLVLLVQRPIKAGDWIVVGQNQGYVKRINVISTEITTFDNATVIVPNSQLMTTEVLNWTHRGRLGRVVIPVGVSYSSDPEQVRDLLLKCAVDNETVLSRPAPSVVFRAFGESSLDFEIRFFIRDIDYTIVVASDVRFAIKKALDEAGIEIPFPQRDIHYKNLPTGAANSPA